MAKMYRIIQKDEYVNGGCIPVTIFWVQVRERGWLSDKWINVKGFDKYERAKALLDMLN